eukprot:scaffold1161_cov391-Prasinococcus_capsulatus_cf.AAC.9
MGNTVSYAEEAKAEVSHPHARQRQRRVLLDALPSCRAGRGGRSRLVRTLVRLDTRKLVDQTPEGTQLARALRGRCSLFGCWPSRRQLSRQEPSLTSQ